MTYGIESPENTPEMNPCSLSTDSADSVIPFIHVSPYLQILLSGYLVTPFSHMSRFPYHIFLQHDLTRRIFNETTFISP